MAKVNMKDTDYYKSGKQLETIMAALNIAKDKNHSLKLDREVAYSLTPTLCAVCDLELPYEKRHNKFCSRRCAAIFNSPGRRHTEESRKKISDKLTGIPTNRKPHPAFIRVAMPPVVGTCKVCGIMVVRPYVKRNQVTCGKKECRIHAAIGFRTYQNGSRKPVWYFNKHNHTNVLLDSSWEVIIAEFLDKLNISWIRPKSIAWEDEGKIVRQYYPDFYLPEYDTYLDPKNPYCMVKDEYKLKVISEKVTLIYGSLKVVKSGITKLLKASQPTH